MAIKGAPLTSEEALVGEFKLKKTWKSKVLAEVKQVDAANLLKSSNHWRGIRMGMKILARSF